jgi:hypothetical protein
MLLMLALPVLIAVAAMHRYLQLNAPSNLLARRVGTAVPTFRMGIALVALAAILLTLMHVLAEAIAAGAPGWLNLVVLVLAWDALKIGCLAVCVILRSIVCVVRQSVGRASQVPQPTS